jgi:hypothetical protein
MTIGFVVSFFDFRNDVRHVVNILAQKHNLVIYGNAAQQDVIMKHLPGNVQFRPIIEEKRTLKNRLLEYAFMLIRKIPVSKHNYYLMEWFKAANIKSEELQKKAGSIIKRQQGLPKVMSYDFLLNNLDYKAQTKIDDIEKFIFFSEVADSYFLARLLAERKEIKLYVYSWDHAFKHTRFSKKLQYICWSEGAKDDLVDMQHIPAGNIKVVGASQFGYIYEFAKLMEEGRLKRTFHFEYIYFGCAIGINQLVEQELEILKKLAEATKICRPDLKFVVRPYPVLNNWQLYDDLKKIENVILDDGFRGTDLAVKEEFIFEKFEKIQNAVAFIHLGTTMGLEACYTDTPSLIVDFGYSNKDILSLYSFIHQSQNEKYLINVPGKNVIKSIGDYQIFLETNKTDVYIDFNIATRAKFPLVSFEQFSEELIAD